MFPAKSLYFYRNPSRLFYFHPNLPGTKKPAEGTSAGREREREREKLLKSGYRIRFLYFKFLFRRMGFAITVRGTHLKSVLPKS